MASKQFTRSLTTADVLNETPVGTQDYSNKTFTLVNVPAAGAVKFYINNVRQTDGTDYTISGKTITMTDAPSPNDTLVVDYAF